MNRLLYVSDTLKELGAVGEDNAITSRKLCTYMGITGEHVRKMVYWERSVNGTQICGDQHGYYIASCPEEVRAQRIRTESRITAMMASNKAFEKWKGKYID